MKNNIKTGLFILVYLLTTFTMVGCKGIKSGLSENQDISACGVNNPLVNLDWLAEYVKGHKSSLKAIYLYQNTSSKENYIAIYIKSNRQNLLNINIYNCNHDLLFKWYTGTPPSPIYRAFFSDKERVATIWEVKENGKN